eukprot:3503341-Lingulodinium_polyedra.AAC.1
MQPPFQMAVGRPRGDLAHVGRSVAARSRNGSAYTCKLPNARLTFSDQLKQFHFEVALYTGFLHGHAGC